MRGVSIIGSVVAAAAACACGGDHVGDGGGSGDGGSAVVDAGPGELRLRFEEIALPAFDAYQTEFHFLPDGSDELVLLEKDGRVVHLALEGDSATELGSFTVPGVHSDSACGLISFAFDPAWEDNHFVYAGHCVNADFGAITRFTFDGSNYDEAASTALEVMRVGDDRATYPWHTIGSMGFDPDGNLWALWGDKVVSDNGQDTTNNNASLIRIVPNRDPEGAGEAYLPAAGNLFADSPDQSQDIFAYGFRSPWRGSLDSQGRYWVADVGSNRFEEINVIDGDANRNGAWPEAEGLCEESCQGFDQPVAVWSEDSEHPYAVDDPATEPVDYQVAWVGIEYQFENQDRYGGLMDGKMLFGDTCLGWVRSLEVDAAGAVVADRYVGHLAGVSSWDVGSDDYFYVWTLSSCTVQTGPGKLWRAVPAE